MTAAAEKRRARKEQDEMEEPRVVDFLLRHPEFFDRHPEMLETLTLDHATGTAVSLIERQVEVLRERNEQLRARLSTLLDTARDNEERVMRIHRLSRALLRAKGVYPVVTTVKRRLRDDFGVDAVVVALFSDHAKRGSNPRYVAPDDPLRKHLKDFMRTRMTVCGELDEDFMRELFPRQRKKLRSAALAPLDRSKPLGLIAMASADQRKFTSGMGTLFLDMASELTATALRRYL